MSNAGSGSTWWGMLSHPYRTLRQIQVHLPPWWQVFAILTLAACLSRVATEFRAGKLEPFGTALAPWDMIWLLLEIIAVIAANTIIAFVLLWMGRWLGGRGSYRQLLTALAWPNLLYIPVQGALLVSLLLFAKPTLAAGFSQSTLLTLGAEKGVDTPWEPVLQATDLWVKLLVVQAVGIAQGFSPWRAGFCLVAGLLILVLPLFLVFNWLMGMM